MDIIDVSSALRSVISILHKRLRKQMYSVATHSITELETMGFLYREPPLLPSQLAALTRVKTQSMSQILNKMELQKIIKRTPSKVDKRKIYISLTAAGKKLVEQTRYERDEWLSNSIEKSLTTKEKKALENAILILTKLAKTP